MASALHEHLVQATQIVFNRIYTTTKGDHIAFNLAVIGDDFKASANDHFDKDYMAKLFDYARARGRMGYAWKKAPPGFAR